MTMYQQQPAPRSSSKALKGCGCALAVAALAGLAALARWWFVFRDHGPQLPPPSGGDLRVVVIDVEQGDSILIISPSGKAALVDAQMRSEAKLERTEEAVASVSEAQTRTEEAVNRLVAAQARTEETMNSLAEGQAHSDRKFEAFMDAVRQDVERRGGRRGGEAKDEGAGGVGRVEWRAVPPLDEAD